MATENYSDSPIGRVRGRRFPIAAHANSDPALHGSRLGRGLADRVCNNLTHRK
jgi:hypothetical protein